METNHSPDRESLAAATQELSLRLWELRELLNDLVYRQEVQRLLLAAGSVRFLARVAGELDEVVGRIHALDASRAAASARLTSLVGLPADASLVEIAARLDQGTAEALNTHLSALRSLQVEIAALQQVNVEMSHRGAQAAKDVVDALSGPSVETYTPRGATNRVSVQPSRLDRSL